MKTEIEDLNLLVKAVEEAKQRVLDHKAAICDRYSPVHVGDDVTVNGYSHEGKKIKVDKVVLYNIYGRRWQFRAVGYIYKLSGELGAQRGEWHHNR